MTATVRVADLPEPWASDPYLRAEHADGAVRWFGARGTTSVLAVVQVPGRDVGAFGNGSPDEVASLLLEGLAADADAWSSVAYLTLPRGTYDLLPRDVHESLAISGTGGDWDWMWTDAAPSAPPTPPGLTVERVDPVTGLEEMREAQSRCHPTSDNSVEDPQLVAWWVAREHGRVVAMCGVVARRGMPGHLVSVGTDPQVRGRGLAAVVVAAATRDCLAWPVERPMVSLGLYAANHTARRLYERVGYRVAGTFGSRRLGSRARGETAPTD